MGKTFIYLKSTTHLWTQPEHVDYQALIEASLQSNISFALYDFWGEPLDGRRSFTWISVSGPRDAILMFRLGWTGRVLEHHPFGRGVMKARIENGECKEVVSGAPLLVA